MSPLAKVFIVLNAVLALVLFGAVATVYNGQQSWKETAQKSSDQLTELSDEWVAKKETLDGQIARLSDSESALTNDVNSKDAELVDLREQINTLKQEKSALVQEKDQIRANLEQEQNTVAALNTRLTETEASRDKALADQSSAAEDAKNAKTANARLVLDIEQLQEDLAQASIQINDINSALADKTLMIDSLVKAGVDISSIIAAPPAPPIDAIVAQVSNEDGLAVITVGAENGIEVGHEFTLFDGDNFVARARVVQADPKMSAVRILYPSDAKVSAGNSATTRLLY